MQFLYEKIETIKEIGQYLPLPQYVKDNLNPSFELRPYQEDAFCNFITYFESSLKKAPTQTLFHMATGSGKTLIMAGLMLYLYKQGYRNFLFFVNLSNIIMKTKENFLSKSSLKYLFKENINIDGKQIKIKEVSNFQDCDPDAINICFTTIQALHYDLWNVKENGISFDDFLDKKVVMISDEAHHLNSWTQHQNSEFENNRNWELTVEKILQAKEENVLLEFTATCDIKNPDILRKYENKIIFNYPLSKFRDDLYSKEIKTLRTDSTMFDRCLQAVLLSQYRLKIFQDNHINIKPVILFKSHRIKENAENMSVFVENISRITGDRIKNVFANVIGQIPIMKEAYQYFSQKDETFENLAQELKENFSAYHCISANGDKEVEKNQIYLNSLERLDNPFRAVFAVDKLNEGWDVLNLFDIVRLYETRDGRNGIPGSGTIAEAQLIGRGARYCPFQVEESQSKFQRKYDKDVENPLRVCETLYFHCWNEPRYISELHTALREIGLDIDNIVTKQYLLKESFKCDDFYKNGFVFTNEKILKTAKADEGLPEEIRKEQTISFSVGMGGEDILLDEISIDLKVESFQYSATIAEISKINYSTVYRALRQFDVFKFNALKTRFPHLKSTYEFITKDIYLGGIKLRIVARTKNPSMGMLYHACKTAFSKIALAVANMQEQYYGSEEFRAQKISDFIKDKSINCAQIYGSVGYSQNDPSVDSTYRLDLTNEDWFVFNDNFGTSEEKRFVAYFKNFVPALKQKYDEIFLIRNERQVHLFSFDNAERFEPDYILYLRKKIDVHYENTIVYIEVKGQHLIKIDDWKEKFLLQLQEKARPIFTSANGDTYKISGFHFFNSESTVEFNKDMNSL